MFTDAKFVCRLARRILGISAFMAMLTALGCGGGSSNSGPTAPSLSSGVSSTAKFSPGQQGATYTITVSNAAGAQATSGTVTVTDPPTGFTVTAISGPGWTCDLPTLTCTRSDALAGGASYPPITVTGNVGANATTVSIPVNVSGGGSAASSFTGSVSVAPPALTITKTHTGNFLQGQLGATYTVTVSNGATAGPTVGTVTVTDTAPPGETLVATAGTGWTCTVAPTCTRLDPLAAGASYPAITVTVNVAANASTPQANSVSVSGGNSATASTQDSTTIVVPLLSITKTHTGNFNQGQAGAAYTLTVSNAAGAATTNAKVTVTDTVPSGLTLVSMAGTGWTCPGTGGATTCDNVNPLAAGASYPAITATVNVASNASTPQINSVSVSGGGAATANNTDSTTIVEPVLSINKTHTGNFAPGQQNATYTVTVTNNGLAATTGKVTVTDTVPSGLTLVSMAGTGWTCPGTAGANTCDNLAVLGIGATFPAITVTVNVGATATSPQVNSVSASGGGSAIASHNDSTIIAILNTCAGAGTGNEALLTGTYVFMLQGFMNESSLTAGVQSFPGAEVFSITFDGAGNVTIDSGGLGTGGEGNRRLDANAHFVVYSTVAGTQYPGGSRYTVGSDNRACLQLTGNWYDPLGVTSSTATYRLALGGVGSGGAPAGVASRGDAIEYDSTSNLNSNQNIVFGFLTSGILRRATPADFTSSNLKADYALGMDGVNGALGHFNIVGHLPLVNHGSTGATISGAVADWNNRGTLGSNLSGGTGSIGAISPTTGFATGSFSIGSGATAYSANWAIYMVNANELFIISTDQLNGTIPLAVGRMIVTGTGGSFTAAAVAGGAIVQQTGAVPTAQQDQTQADVDISQVTLTAVGAQTGTLSGTDFSDNLGSGGFSQTPISGNFTISGPSGRIGITGGGGGSQPVLYTITPQSNTEQFIAFIAGTGTDAEFGYAEAQPSGVTFSNTSLSGPYTFASRDPGDGATIDVTGTGTFSTTTPGQIVVTRDSSQNSGLTTGSATTFSFSINADGTGNAGTSTAAVTNGTDIFYVDGTSGSPIFVRVFEK